MKLQSIVGEDIRKPHIEVQDKTFDSVYFYLSAIRFSMKNFVWFVTLGVIRDSNILLKQ